MEGECGTREDSIRESSIMHAAAAAVFSPKVEEGRKDDWKMSRVLRHDGLMVLFVRLAESAADTFSGPRSRRADRNAECAAFGLGAVHSGREVDDGTAWNLTLFMTQFYIYESNTNLEMVSTVIFPMPS